MVGRQVTRMARWLAGALLAAVAGIGLVLLTGGTAAADEAGTGSITIVLDASPDDGQDITFTGCRDEWCGPFTLDDDADPTRSNTISGDFEPGTYTVTQDTIANWTLTSLACDAGETTSLAHRRATIDLAAGEDVTCTFTLTSASITIVQDASPDSGRDFTYSGCLGSGCADFTLDDDTDSTLARRQSGAGLAPGTYTVTQAPDTTWVLTTITCTTGESASVADRRVTITLTEGEQTTCTFTNQAASITVIQDTSPDDGQDFAFEGCLGSGCAPFVLDDDDNPEHPSSISGVGLAPGTYRVSSRTNEPNWPRTGLTCSSGSVSGAKDRVDITLVPGRQVTCTFANEYSTQAGTLALNVDSQPDGPSDVTMRRCGPDGCDDVVLDDDLRPDRDRTDRASLAAGWYSVSVDPVPDHEVASIECGTGDRNVDIGAGTFEVAVFPGEHASCTVVHRRPPPRLGGITDLSVGMQSACAAMDDGRARCWGIGEDYTGLLGTGNAGDSTTPEEVVGVGGAGPLADVADVSVGFSHACAALDDGQARCWGYNPRGAVGDGTIQARQTPVAVSDGTGSGPLTGVDSIGAGANHTCALIETGEVWCWGGNTDGELGDGTTADHLRPAAVSRPDGAGPLTGVRGLTVGLFHACALRDAGTIACWGANNTGQAGDGSANDRLRPAEVQTPDGSGVLDQVIQVSAGHQHTCAVLASTEVRCWGRNADGELGDGTTTNRHRPVVVSNPAGTGPLTGAVQVAAGGARTCALLQDGTVNCWGRNADGLLGSGSSEPIATRPQPVLTEAGAGRLGGVAAVTVGWNATCVVLTDGQGRCWGGAGGIVGDGTDTPQPRPRPLVDPFARTAIDGVAQVDAGNELACASGAGRAQCWGLSALGNLDTWLSRSAVDVRNEDDTDRLSGVATVSAGGSHACAVLDDGRLRCWGANHEGEVGDGTTELRRLPTPVADVGGSGTLSDVVAVSAGDDRACALVVTGEARGWGANHEGQLGDGTTTRRTTPVVVLDETGSGPLDAIVDLAADGNMTCAALDSGQVRCWGEDHVLPTAVPNPEGTGPLTDVVQLSGGGDTTCATLVDGEARCWDKRVLDGASSTTVVPDPAGAGPLTGVESIGRSANLTCALLGGGRVACWSASNAVGQLGTLPPANTGRPTLVLDPETGLPLSGADDVAAHADGACAVKDGNVLCWGLGVFGTLGDGTHAAARFRPTLVRTSPT